MRRTIREIPLSELSLCLRRVNPYYLLLRQVRPIERNEVVELLLYNRNFLYQLLYKAFARKPDMAFLELLTAENTGESFALLGGEVLGKMPAFLEEIRAEMSEPRVLDRLEEEYMRLFVGPLKMVAPPWESVYTGEEGMLFQESTLEVREFYRRFGLIPEGYPRVADDSLPLELGFMAELAQRSVAAFESGDGEARVRNLEGSLEFLNAHLLVWVPRLLEKMANTPTDWLYPQLTLALNSFLEKDKETLTDLLTEGVHAHD